jgi:hypothetical protein
VPTRPLDLPWCNYPGVEDVQCHGLQSLPEQLPTLDLGAVRPYRSQRYRISPLALLETSQILATAEEVARSFAQRCPMARHIRPPAAPPKGLMELRHSDPFGSVEFGSWSRANIIYWFIRLFVLTDPTSPTSAVRINKDALDHSLAVLTPSGKVIGGAFNETMPTGDAQFLVRKDDAFLAAVVSFGHPILSLLQAQDQQSLSSLSHRYPDFGDALTEGRVGHHFMVARSDDLAVSDTFELVAATAELFSRARYAYLCVEATNQWTGAALEILSGVRVHFSPFYANAICKSEVPLTGLVTSSNGFISDKDSGSMFYVVALGNAD